MHLDVAGPLPCGLVAWRSPSAGDALTVVVKATFELRPGVCGLPAAQEALREREEAYGGDPRRPVYAPADLVPFKLWPEVMLVGSAFAASGERVAARFVVGGVDKAVEVAVPRGRSGGGAERVAAPLGAAGCGPVAPYAGSRVPLLGRAGLHGLPRSWHGVELPVDLDPLFFQEAPEDQRVEGLRADEGITLIGLSPRHARLVTRLPGVFPAAVVERAGRPPDGLAMVADTLWIDTDNELCTLAWRGMVRLSHAGEPGVVRVRIEGLPRAEPGFAPSPFNGAAAAPAEAAAPVVAVPVPAPVPATEYAFMEPPAVDSGPLEPPRPLPAPPPMIGPLATADMALPAPPPAAPPPDDSSSAAGGPAPAAEPAAPSLPLNEYSLARCAAIAASIARRKADEPKIIEENGLDAPTWLELKAHHDAAISAEVRRGKLDLLKAYDRAYVDRLEKERGPITVQQYARLLVATERGTADEALRDLDLPRGAALRIERLWTERSARDPAVAAQLREAVRAARSA